MPRLPSLVLRRIGAAAALLALIAVCVAAPARHVILPAWPERVYELLHQTEPGRVERRFLPASQMDPEAKPVLARSRPSKLWRIETDTGQIDHVWLAGVRNEEGQLLPAPPPWLDPVRLDGPLPDVVRLVAITRERETREIEGDTIVRMYRPNEMRLPQRLGLMRERLTERWEWPFRARGDERTRSPAR